MPEVETFLRTAGRLRAALAAKQLVALDVRHDAHRLSGSAPRGDHRARRERQTSARRNSPPALCRTRKRSRRVAPSPVGVPSAPRAGPIARTVLQVYDGHDIGLRGARLSKARTHDERDRPTRASRSSTASVPIIRPGAAMSKGVLAGSRRSRRTPCRRPRWSANRRWPKSDLVESQISSAHTSFPTSQTSANRHGGPSTRPGARSPRAGPRRGPRQTASSSWSVGGRGAVGFPRRRNDQQPCDPGAPACLGVPAVDQGPVNDWSRSCGRLAVTRTRMRASRQGRDRGVGERARLDWRAGAGRHGLQLLAD